MLDALQSCQGSSRAQGTAPGVGAAPGTHRCKPGSGLDLGLGTAQGLPHSAAKAGAAAGTGVRADRKRGFASKSAMAGGFPLNTEWGSSTKLLRRANKTNRWNQNLSATNSQPFARIETPHEMQLFDPEIFFPPLKACTDAGKKGPNLLQIYLMLKSPDLELSAFGHPTIYNKI